MKPARAALAEAFAAVDARLAGDSFSTATGATASFAWRSMSEGNEIGRW